MSDSTAQQISALKDAIQALEKQRPNLGDAGVDASIAALQQQIAELEAQINPLQQRKLVTILFMDVVGSTSTISTRLDPEDTLEIMDQSLKRLAQPIAEHGGHVTRFMGDGFMAVFGSPVAHENDAEMAVHAGLEVLKLAGGISTELNAKWQIPSFQVRVGINTGLVALGGLTEAEDTIMGSTVNLAARLESAAPPGGLLISHATYQHVASFFIAEPLEPIHAKGFDELIHVYLVHKSIPRAFRLSTRGVEGVETRMIGRQEELKILQDALNRLLHDTRGQAIMITGEAGVGKSRLLYEFQRWMKMLPDEISLYLARARQESQHQPYSLLRDLFAQRFQIQEDDPVESVLTKIENGFTGLIRMQDSHLVAQLLGFDFQDSPHIQALQEDARLLRDRALIAIGEYFRLVSQRSPTVIFLEDIHWADESSLDFVRLLRRKAASLPLMILCVARPFIFERRSDWGEDRNGHYINLTSLTIEESHQLLNEILQKVAHIPDALHELVVGGADGNPFYIEELIKMLIGSGVIIQGEEAWQVEPARLTKMDVPPTLTGVLQARLDSLPARERNLLQEASVVGRTFWDRILVYLHTSEEANLADAEVTAALTSLQNKELIFRHQESSIAESGEYLFKHVMLRDVTYESVLKRKRRVYHARVAQWLIENSAGRTGEYAGLIADHLERAGKGGEAIGFLVQAGERAARQYANREAVSYYSRALALTPQSDLESRYRMLLARERVLDLQGLRHPQEEDLQALKQIALELDDVCKRAEVALRQVLYHNHAGNFPASLAMLDEAILLAQQAEDARCEGALQMQWGIALWRQGKYASARPTLEQALAMAQSAHLDTVAGDGIRTLGPAFARVLADKQSSARFEQALEKYRQAGDRRGEAYTLDNLGQYQAEFKGNHSRAREYYEQALLIWREIGDSRGEGRTVYNLGINAAKAGEYEQAKSWLSASLDIYSKVGDRWGERLGQTAVGECFIHTGEYDRVLDCYQQAHAISQEIGDRRGELTVLRLIGNYYRELGGFDRARSYYDQVLRSLDELDQAQDKAQLLFDLGLLLHQVGEDQAALERCQEATGLIAAGDFPESEWMGLTLQGYCQASLGMLEGAEIAYKKASAKASRWRITLPEFESTAGVAHVLLVRGQAGQALLCIEKLLSHLQHNPASGTHSPLDGTLEPLRIYYTCYQVLKANGDARAHRVFAQAYEILQARASTIDDEKLRTSYLNRPPASCQIQKEYLRIFGN